jgi:hypothetical protein
VGQEAADKFVGIEDHRFFSVLIFSVPVTEGDLTVLDVEDAVIGEGDAVGITAEVIEDSLWGAERLFGIDDPGLTNSLTRTPVA